MNQAARTEITLWLPPWARWRSQIAAGTLLHRVACRADRETVEAGDEARIGRSFDILPRGLPLAALTRQMDAGDAMHFTWLRADPGYLRPDMASARLMACGDLGLTAQECEALIKPLRPLFGDAGVLISAPVPSRWYLCLPPDARLPAFSPPQDVLGDDLFAHLPEGPLGQRWRQLLNEAQMVLHTHPLNAERAAAGKLPVNTLWFWGAGRMPDHVRSRHSQVSGQDALLQALGKAAGIKPGIPNPGAALLPGALLDLRHLDTPDRLEKQWLKPVLARIGKEGITALVLDFGDGLVLRWRNGHRWRFWRQLLPA